MSFVGIIEASAGLGSGRDGMREGLENAAKRCEVRAAMLATHAAGNLFVASSVDVLGRQAIDIRAMTGEIEGPK